MRQILVVANQTLGGRTRGDASGPPGGGAGGAVDPRPGNGGARHPTWPCSAQEAAPPPQSRAVAASEALPEVGTTPRRRRPEASGAVDKLGQLGAPVGGEVGDPDPLHAISDVLDRRQFDEIVISTLPSGISRWLHTDLPSRVHASSTSP